MPHIYHLTEIDSTNNYAMELIDRKNARHGDVYYADFQHKGKGQKSKTWSSEKGKNIMLSMILNTDNQPIKNLFFLSAAMAIAARDFFAKYALQSVRIKFPNDIYWQDRKAGGILIENKILGQNWKWSVVGIGININQSSFSPELCKKAVSLKQITGKSFCIATMVEELSNYLLKNFELFAQKDFQRILATYNRFLYKRGEIVQFKRDNIVFTAQILEVNQHGKLLLKSSLIEEFSVGDLVMV